MDVKANKLDTGWEINQALVLLILEKETLVDPNNEFNQRSASTSRKSCCKY